MKKVLMFAMMLGAASVFAEDAYLYWLVPDEVDIGGGTIAGNYHARVIAGGDAWAWNDTGDGGAGDYLNLYNGAGKPTGAANVTLGAGADNFPFFADAAGMAGKTFYIELWNDGGTLVGISEGLAYSSAGLGALAGMGTPGTLWQGMNFAAAPIPEPNSGLLMLIGCALLGLRRKQKKA